MDHAAQGYTTSLDPGRQMPLSLQQYLDGTGLPGKTQALRLATVDAAGWLHAALLSAGDALAVSAQTLRFALWAQSQTAANLARDGRLVLTLALDRGLCELRLHARRLAGDDGPLALFEATVEQVRHHAAPYADVTSGITFSLHEPEAVQARWLRQIAALKSAG